MSVIDQIIVYATVFGVGSLVLFALARLFHNAARNLPTATQRTARCITIGLWVWAALAVFYALSVGLSFPKLVPMLAIPWACGAWAMFSRSGSDILRKVPVHTLISLSVYRTAGIVFIYCYYSCGTLSRGFALNAGWGDVLTGILAIPTAWVVYSKASYSKHAFALWSIIGIGDLILAPVSAAIYGAERLTDFPINLIPLFLGPPFGILLHLVTIRAYWLHQTSAENAS